MADYKTVVAIEADAFTEILEEIEKRGETYQLVGEGEDPVDGPGSRNMRLVVDGVATPIILSFGGGTWHAQTEITWSAK